MFVWRRSVTAHADAMQDSLSEKEPASPLFSEMGKRRENLTIRHKSAPELPTCSLTQIRLKRNCLVVQDRFKISALNSF
jgi:hypothetical protein